MPFVGERHGNIFDFYDTIVLSHSPIVKPTQVDYTSFDTNCIGFSDHDLKKDKKHDFSDNCRIVYIIGNDHVKTKAE